MPLAILGGIGVGALVGLVNGLVVVRLRIPAFIQTLGMLFIGQGLIQVVTDGYPVYPLPPAIGDIGMTDLVFGLGWSFVFFIVAAIVADFVLRRTVLGRNMYATGGNPEVARLVGINTSLYKIGAFIVVGALAAIAGMFVMADLASGTTSIGSGWELTVIAGVVVGGVSLFGGAGTMAGGVVGILLLQGGAERPRRHRRQLQLAADRGRRDHGAGGRPRHPAPPLLHRRRRRRERSQDRQSQVDA